MDLHSVLRLIDLAGDSIIACDSRGLITYWNRGAERVFGWSREEALNQNMHALLRSEFPEAFKSVREALLKHDHWEGDVLRRTRFNAPVTMACRWTVQRDAHGEPEAFLEIGNDISARLSREAQSRQSERMESVGRLAGGVAHDFNNLLTVIIGRCNLLASRVGDNAKMRRDVDLIQKTAEKAAVLTRQLLAFGRRQPLRAKVVDLNRLISSMDTLLRRLAGDNVELRLVLAPKLGKLRADPGQIEQVISNLVENARDAMPDGGRLTIETSNVHTGGDDRAGHGPAVSGPSVMLAVTDTGRGIDADVQSRMFEPFFTTGELGAGLGLSAVYGIVKQSGGSISVSSEAGLGTTFRLYWPLVEHKPQDAPAGENMGRDNLETVLVVQREKAAREAMCETLRTQGYRVLEASGGAEAAELAGQHSGPIQLLITDLVGTSGGDVAEAVLRERPDTRVLYISGNARAAAADGCKDSLRKQDVIDLPRRVREILDR